MLLHDNRLELCVDANVLFLDRLNALGGEIKLGLEALELSSQHVSFRPQLPNLVWATAEISI